MKIIIKSFIITALFTTIIFANNKLNIIKLKKAKGMYNAKSALFLDARRFELYKKGTIMGAVHMPNKKFKRYQKWLPYSKKAKIVTFCNGFKCEESDYLAKKIMKLGYTRVYVYKGGYPQWKKEKLPSMSLIKKCKTTLKSPYRPKNKKVSINGVKVYLGGEAVSDGMIDQFWFSNLLNQGKSIKNIQLVDLRKPSQFKEGHLPNAINIPWDKKNEKFDYVKLPSDKLIVMYCNTGMMATDARGSLDDKVARNVLYLDANVVCHKGKKCKVIANENF
ncbi:SULFUR TRANSFERASE PRECURSOR [hydrothermal vent metagenome]|uniref:SULFUR TRANSFERASE n=1 Tax=hydrothermal vent metagenome TaxID=652676 RepID=A0A3B1E6T3_9ZZZZ